MSTRPSWQDQDQRFKTKTLSLESKTKVARPELDTQDLDQNQDPGVQDQDFGLEDYNTDSNAPKTPEECRKVPLYMIACFSLSANINKKH
jgi:hypothetical protein